MPQLKKIMKIKVLLRERKDGPDLGRFVCIASLGQDDLICASTVRNRPDAMSVVTICFQDVSQVSFTRCITEQSLPPHAAFMNAEVE